MDASLTPLVMLLFSLLGAGMVTRIGATVLWPMWRAAWADARSRDITTSSLALVAATAVLWGGMAVTCAVSTVSAATMLS